MQESDRGAGGGGACAQHWQTVKVRSRAKARKYEEASPTTQACDGRQRGRERRSQKKKGHAASHRDGAVQGGGTE